MNRVFLTIVFFMSIPFGIIYVLAAILRVYIVHFYDKQAEKRNLPRFRKTRKHINVD